MATLALDVSTKTGWALFDDKAQPVSFGVLESQIQWDDQPYPINFIAIAEHVGSLIARKVMELMDDNIINDIVIEEINKTGRFGSRFSQKLLDMTHYTVVKKLMDFRVRIHYINTSTWRKHLGLSVADTKKMAKPHLKTWTDLKRQFDAEKDKSKKQAIKVKLDEHKEFLKKKCIHGKIDKKSISVAYANLKWDKEFKKGDNDITDALAQGYSFLTGAPTVTNKEIFEGK
jgi:hypothetical protein